MWPQIILALLRRFLGGAAAAPSAPEPARRAPVPAIPGLDLARLTTPHGAFDSAATWHLTAAGLSVNGAPPVGTPGAPLTAMAAFRLFGAEFRAAAAEFRVPVELLTACACTEAGVHIRQGLDAARLSERREPGFVSYATTPHRVSIGVMHTLLSTARQALHDPTIMPVDLYTPLVSIRAGAAYMAAQSRHTGFDPPLVAAAYNAGGVYDDPTPGLPYSLRDYPAGEDRHIERFVAYFNDVCRLVGQDAALAGSAPSFVRMLRP